MRIRDLLHLTRQPTSDAALYIAARQRAGRWQVEPVAAGAPDHRGGWWAEPMPGCGDSPRQYHPKYLMAMLSVQGEEDDPGNRVVPEIDFSTDESVRRSMALNGMRMTMEYFQTDSPRVLQLVRQRLEAGQRDVVHDVLVYLAQHIQGLRDEERETRLLRAESVAAYLGLSQAAVNDLFLQHRLDPVRLAERISAGAAGPLRRSIDVETLLRAQLEVLRPALLEHRREERRALGLLDQVLVLLRADTHTA